MTTEPATSRFSQQSLLGIGASIGAGVVAGLVCYAVKVPPYVQAPVMGGVVGLPAAIDYSLQSRRRDPAEDAARIRRGDLNRPVGLVVTMMAAALILAISLGWALGVLVLVVTTGGTGLVVKEDLSVQQIAVLAPIILVPCALAFFIGRYASHYLGKHPYRWTFVAFGCAFVYEALWGLFAAVEGQQPAGQNLPALFANFIAIVMVSVIYLWVCLLGTAFGRLHHDKFLANKLVRVERQAARAAATQPGAQTAPQQPSQASGPDALEGLNKLAKLRDARVLTEEEFQSKKAEILAGLDDLEQLYKLKKLGKLRDAGVLTEEEFQAKKAEILARI